MSNQYEINLEYIVRQTLDCSLGLININGYKPFEFNEYEGIVTESINDFCNKLDFSNYDSLSNGLIDLLNGDPFIDNLIGLSEADSIKFMVSRYVANFMTLAAHKIQKRLKGEQKNIERALWYETIRFFTGSSDEGFNLFVDNKINELLE